MKKSLQIQSSFILLPSCHFIAHHCQYTSPGYSSFIKNSYLDCYTQPFARRPCYRKKVTANAEGSNKHFNL